MLLLVRCLVLFLFVNGKVLFSQVNKQPMTHVVFFLSGEQVDARHCLDSVSLGHKMCTAANNLLCILFQVFGTLNINFLFLFLLLCCWSTWHAFVKHFKTDSAQGSSNECKNYLLKICPWHGNFLNTV